MAERSDITIDWGVFSRSSPRIIEIDAPSRELILQDLVDTIRSDSLGESTIDALDDDALLGDISVSDAVGKIPVQPGLLVGIIATLFNAKLRFAARGGPATELCTITEGDLVVFLQDTGTQTGADSNTVLIDSAADFINFGIEEKELDKFTVFNRTDGSSATLVTLDSGIQITTDGLTGGSDNLFQAGDIIQVEGFATSPIAPSAFTTVSYAASVSPSIQTIVTIENRIRELWKLLGLDTSDAITVTPSGITSQSGTITINFTGDGINTTTQTRA